MEELNDRCSSLDMIQVIKQEREIHRACTYVQVFGEECGRRRPLEYAGMGMKETAWGDLDWIHV
jgi:hypothetical protein